MNDAANIAKHSLCTLIYFIYSTIAVVCSKTWSRIKFNALITSKGQACFFHWSVFLKYPHNIKVGNNVKVARQCVIGARAPVIIGNNVILSYGVMIETAGLNTGGSLKNQYVAEKIEIHDDVWVGAGSIVLGGVRIGKGSVIGAGAIITRNIPDNSLVVGYNRVIRTSTQRGGNNASKP